MVLYKGIVHERTEDAPFVGALVLAPTCTNNCQGCFNQHLKDAPLYEDTAANIIAAVKRNVFNEGIILGGLEWSERPMHALALIQAAKAAKLQVMLYTGLTEEQFYLRIPHALLHNCYVKFGSYDESKAVSGYSSYGVSLASGNQYIVYYR